MTLLCREVQVATSLLCDSGGAMRLQRLETELGGRGITPREVDLMVNRCARFLLVRGPGGDVDCTVVARTSLRLCRAYSRGQCEAPDCEDLHLCRFFIYGSCRFGKGRKPCRFSHDIQSEHNHRQLRDSTLHDLPEEDLFFLLLQNDPALLPEVCVHYNHGVCTFKEKCTKVHLCLHYIQGGCMFGQKCNRQHGVNEHDRSMLVERGLSGDIIDKLPIIYRNHGYLNLVATPEDNLITCEGPVKTPRPPSPTREVKVQDWERICLFFLVSNCKFKEKCKFVHFNQPFKWEVFTGNEWKELENMVDVEREFCDPNKDQSSGVASVNFDHMTMDSQPVRRISTVSAALRPRYKYATDWRWYFKRHEADWMEYSAPFKQDDGKGAFLSSKYLEKQYQSDKTASVKVVKGQREYVISFCDMYQRNLKYKIKRRIRRRPCLVSVEDGKVLPHKHAVNNEDSYFTFNTP